MAPEILSGKGYNHLCDLWSIGMAVYILIIKGVCVFEFFCGGVPYGEELDDPFEIHETILRSRTLKFPHLEDKTTKNFIEILLNKIPVNRLNGSYSNLKTHALFDGFNWVTAINKDDLGMENSKGPYIPDVTTSISDKDIEAKF
jgi:cGMP-dependent protein kinase 1